MAISKARHRANEKYNAKAYDQIELRVIKGKKAKLKEHAQNRGESLNGFINRAIDEAVARDDEKTNPIQEEPTAAEPKENPCLSQEKTKNHT